MALVLNQALVPMDDGGHDETSMDISMFDGNNAMNTGSFQFYSELKEIYRRFNLINIPHYHDYENIVAEFNTSSPFPEDNHLNNSKDFLLNLKSIAFSSFLRKEWFNLRSEIDAFATYVDSSVPTIGRHSEDGNSDIDGISSKEKENYLMELEKEAEIMDFFSCYWQLIEILLLTNNSRPFVTFEFMQWLEVSVISAACTLS